MSQALGIIGADQGALTSLIPGADCISAIESRSGVDVAACAASVLPALGAAVSFGFRAGISTARSLVVRDLLGASDDIVVLGRLPDTAAFRNRPGHVILDTPRWSLSLNDDFIAGAIADRRTIYLASPLEGNLVQGEGRFAGNQLFTLASCNNSPLLDIDGLATI